ncbi:hypothetical protein [Photobacterium leiognathi]|uniref:hypothetical protein n=1 Tax=Photobacterium leiognathi TaxID=553611 RepID=UPI003DA18D68
MLIIAEKKIFGKYDLVFGFGDCYEYAISNNIANKYILYSTGSPLFYQNQNAIESFHRFKLKNPCCNIDKPQKYIRLTENIWPIQLIKSDSIITIGNQYVKSLFDIFHSNVKMIPSTCFDLEVKSNIDDYKIEKNSIIWFGSKGSIHKGLDLCIDAVIGSNVKLYIAGNIDDEIDIFRDKIIKYPDNIEYIGYLVVGSNDFKKYVESIPFVILPSCSESMATSIVTLSYNYGLIPLVTKECGFDFDGNIIEISSLTLDDVKKSINYALSLSNDDIKNKRNILRKKFRENHSNLNFREKMEAALILAIGDK